MIYGNKDFEIIYSARKKLMKWKIRYEVVIAAMVLENKRNSYAAKENILRQTRKRDRGYALNEMKLITDEEFKRMFRVDRPMFDHLRHCIHPLVTRNRKQARNSSGQEITTETRLAVTLRWLAGGMQLDLCFAFGISRTSFYGRRGVLWPTIKALDSILTLGFPLNKEDELKRLSEEFYAQSDGVLDGCVMAIDGLAIRTRQPLKTEVRNVNAYRCRKGGFAVIVMAGADVRGKFVMATANHCGSTNDVVAWTTTKLRKAIEEDNLLDGRYFLIGDEAFPCTQQFLSPWPGRGLGVAKDGFNYWLSHSRQCIERAFGMLINRWGIFWRELDCAFPRWPLIITVCMKLHNLCMDRNVPMPIRRHNEDNQPGDQFIVLENNDPELDDVLRPRAMGDRRQEITDRLETQGKFRPPFAMSNSRA